MTHRAIRLAAALMFLLPAACSNPQEDWETARDADTREAYREFLEQYPDGEYADRARARLAAMERAQAWETAQAENTAEAYDGFLKKFPEGTHSDEVLQRRTQLERETEWEDLRARSDVTVERLREFATRFPDSREAAQARSMIEDMEAEPVAPASDEAPEIDDAPEAGAAAEAATAGRETDEGDYRVQVGAFRSEQSANAERERLQDAFGDVLGEVVVEPPAAGSGYHRVRSAPMTRDRARETCATLEERKQACIVIER